MIRQILVVMCAGLVLAGCSVYRIDSQEMTADFYPPKDSADKVAYLERIDRPYTVIGVVTVSTERTHSFDEILSKIRSEAAVLGGDAVTDVRSDSSGAWTRLLPGRLMDNAYIRARYSAKVVVLK